VGDPKPRARRAAAAAGALDDVPTRGQALVVHGEPGYWSPPTNRMIPPPAQRAMSERAGSTVVDEAASHSIYVSQVRDRRPDRARRAAGAIETA
jgi:hypothetical protein